MINKYRISQIRNIVNTETTINGITIRLVAAELPHPHSISDFKTYKNKIYWLDGQNFEKYTK